MQSDASALEWNIKGETWRKMNKLWPGANFARSTISRWFDRVETQFPKDGTLSRKKGSGHPSAYTQKEAESFQCALERDGMTQSQMARDEGVHRDTVRRYTRRSGEQSDGCHPHITPEESPLSELQAQMQLDLR